MANANPTLDVADVRDALASIAAVAALLTAQPSDVDRTAGLRLIQLKAACAALRLEQMRAVEPR